MKDFKLRLYTFLFITFIVLVFGLASCKTPVFTSKTEVKDSVSAKINPPVNEEKRFTLKEKDTIVIKTQNITNTIYRDGNNFTHKTEKPADTSFVQYTRITNQFMQQQAEQQKKWHESIAEIFKYIMITAIVIGILIIIAIFVFLFAKIRKVL